MKRAVILNTDYDFYSIPLSFKNVGKGHFSKFILKELEQRHPRFSDSSCYDTKYSFRKGKINADVVVMDKCILAEYRRANKGKKLFLESGPPRDFFNEKNCFPKFLVLFILFIPLIVCTRKLYRNFLVPTKNVSADETGLLNYPELPEDGTEKASVLISPVELVAGVFTAVSKKGGKIRSFSWDGKNCSFCVTGCPAEEIAQAKYCAVSYTNNEPYFSLILPIQEENKTEQSSIAYSSLDSRSFSAEKNCDERNPLEVFASARKKMIRLGAVMQSEQFLENGGKFTFACTKENLYSVLKVLSEAADSNFWIENKFSIESQENQKLIKIQFGVAEPDSLFSFSPLKTVTKYAFLFEEQKGTEQKLLSPLEKKSVEKVTASILGEIHAANGNIFVYYKTPEGKVYYEQKGAVNES